MLVSNRFLLVKKTRNTWVYFLIEDDDLLEKDNTIWDKVSADIKKEFDTKPVYNIKVLETKINLMMLKIQILLIKEFLRWILIILV